MSVNVRTFDGIGDYIEFANVTASGYGTYLSVLKRNSTNYNGIISGRQASGYDRLNLVIMNAGWSNVLDYATNDHDTFAAFGIVNANNWSICAGSKATGMATPRFHKCVLSGPTWTHGNAGSAVGDSDAVTGWVLGRQTTYGNYFGGSMLLACYWDAEVLSDGDLETIDGVDAIFALTPTALWLLNQADIGTPVDDYMGTGADQVAISGTSVTTGVTIPNFAAPTGVVPATVSGTTVVTADLGGEPLIILPGSITGTTFVTADLTVTTPVPSGPPVYPYIALVPSFDVDLVFNKWSSTAPGGVTQVWEDEDSQRDYFLRSKQIESLVVSDSEVLSQIQYKTGQFAQPLNRIDQLTIQPLVDPDDAGYIAAGLSREVGDKITVLETPPGFSSQQENDYVIQQIHGEITPGPINSLQLTFGLWPSSASSFWVAGDAALSLAGISTKPGY